MERVALLWMAWLCGAARAVSPATAPAADWPAAWARAWADPPAEMRPLQIVHGVLPGRADSTAMAAVKAAGLGGIVCNVAFADYMTSEAHWQTLVRAVDAARDAGLVVWIYDEEGYPSGAAGGLVLKDDPRFEATVLAFDPTRPEPFVLRRAYEHTHASNNFHAARRYPNLLDAAAVRSFIDKTHAAYAKRIGPHLGMTVRAFFTDEPSLMAMDTGSLGGEVRKNVRVADPLDAAVKRLPTVPWCDDLPARYRERYGEDLMPHRRSLFTGDTADDCRVRRQYWALVADLLADRYFGAIQEWCRRHCVASSGHLLWEEMPVHHVPLYGNALAMLLRMDIPGLDMLSSDPMAVVHGGWLTASLPASAALFNGVRRVMTEVSDFSQLMAGKGPAPLAEMQATAAWQAAFGVTEFTSYYGLLGRVAAGANDADAAADRTKCRAYCVFVGRLNALLRDARPSPHVLLYYPIRDLWGEYLPVANPLTLTGQSPQTQRLVNSFLQLGRAMSQAQVPFAVVDHERLAAGEVCDGALWIRGHRYDAIILPAGVELPEGAAAVVERFARAGGRLMRDDDRAAAFDARTLALRQRTGPLEPACGHIVAGRFTRDGREILLLVNVGDAPYTGRVRVPSGSRWWLADPATGGVSVAAPDGADAVRVALPARATLLVGE